MLPTTRALDHLNNATTSWPVTGQHGINQHEIARLEISFSQACRLIKPQDTPTYHHQHSHKETVFVMSSSKSSTHALETTS